MKKAYKFIGKNPKGLYDFVECTACGDEAIDSVQAYIESKGWTELEFDTVKDVNGYELFSFNA
jgi:hypothetical protein